MTDKVEAYGSDDYAVLRLNDIVFYYGYEYTKGDEWCFVVHTNDVNILIMSESELRDVVDINIPESVEEYLLIGIGIFINSQMK